jgi:hypothetical protein
MCLNLEGMTFFPGAAGNDKVQFENMRIIEGGSIAPYLRK